MNSIPCLRWCRPDGCGGTFLQPRCTRERQEEHEFQASLGYENLYQSKNKTKLCARFLLIESNSSPSSLTSILRRNCLKLCGCSLHSTFVCHNVPFMFIWPVVFAACSSSPGLSNGVSGPICRGFWSLFLPQPIESQLQSLPCPGLIRSPISSFDARGN